MAEGTVEIGRNRLLAALGNAGGDLRKGLERVDLGLKEFVYKPGSVIENVFFPIDGIISMVAPAEVGTSIEVATIGNEGMAGLPLFLGTDRAPGACFSQIPGAAYRMSAAAFRAIVERNELLTRVLHLYTQALMTQISQGTACNRAHSIEQRCARWLLLTHDRVRKDQFLLNQEFLGQMLGVRRASVSAIAAKLQRARYIHYSRGRITILNRRGLEAASCICYSIIRMEYERLLGKNRG